MQYSLNIFAKTGFGNTEERSATAGGIVAGGIVVVVTDVAAGAVVVTAAVVAAVVVAVGTCVLISIWFTFCIDAPEARAGQAILSSPASESPNPYLQ